MTKKFITFLAAALLLLAIAVAQNGVRYNYTHTDGVQYACSVYTDSINIDEASTGSVTHVVIPDSIPYGTGGRGLPAACGRRSGAQGCAVEVKPSDAGITFFHAPM